MQNLKDIPCLILGIGNILWADEGFGVRVVEAFNDKYAFTDPNNVIADGGTLGMYLYDRICRAEKLLIFDCCDFKGKPGELRVLRNDDVKLWTATKISPHQTGMNDLLVAAAVRGAIPNDIAVVGFQP
ncbi:HyaD/HybD family hydrogenase maturation endopeptidase, partial [Parasutterella excrementihominis]